jgi:hypothetical protein
MNELVIATWVAAQVGVAVAAALVVGAGATRRAAAALLVGAGATLPWLSPSGPLSRVVLSFVALMAFLKTIQIAFTPGPWPARRRLWHLFVLLDVRRTRFITPAVDWRMLGNVFLQGALAGAAFFVLARLGTLPGQAREVARLICGATLLYAFLEGLSGIMQFGHRVVGIEAPANQHAPILARSAGEFWGERWNRCVSEWLRQFVFRPLARRHQPALGLLAAFAASAALHAWVTAPALGARAAVMMAGFFLVEGVIVLAETRLSLRTWPAPLARAWTIFVLLGPSPLGLDPFLRVFGL